MSYYREDIARRLMRDLMSDYDLTRAQAAGIVGNLAYESAGFKTMQEEEPSVPGSRGGYGYAQWTGSRRRDFEKFVADKDWDITSYQANYGNLKRELDGEYNYVIDLLKDANTVKQASDIFVKKFERPEPATAKYDRRAKLAAEIMVNPNAGFIAPFPLGRGGNRQAQLLRMMMLEPGSGNMGLVERQEPAFHSQYAPGGDGFLGAPRIARQPPPVRSDYPTGPLDPEPWQGSFAPAPFYPPPQASPVISDERQAAAYRTLADGLATAGVGSVGGGTAAAPMEVPVPRARPDGSGRFTPPVPVPRPHRSGPVNVPTPTRRPAPSVQPLPMSVPLPTARPPATRAPFRPPIPVPRPASITTRSMVPVQGAAGPSDHPYTGPKKQILDMLLRNLLDPRQRAR